MSTAARLIKITDRATIEDSYELVNALNEAEQYEGQCVWPSWTGASAFQRGTAVEIEIRPTAPYGPVEPAIF